MSDLICEIRIIEAENVEIGKVRKNGGGCVFVRMYLSAGKNRGRIQLNTHDLPISLANVKNKLKWDSSFSLECKGEEGELKGGCVELEVRWRPTSSRWGKSSSKLLGKAEVPWGPAFGSLIKVWVPLITAMNFKRQPTNASLVVAMRVSEVERRRRSDGEGRCGCTGDHGCANICHYDYDQFALAAALQAF